MEVLRRNFPVIYKITSPSNKIYIGQSWRWDKRQSDYKTLKAKGQPKLHNSILKYGWEKHTAEIIELFTEKLNQEVLDEREIYWWQYYKDLGFEMMNVKEPGKGGKQSSETKEKISIAHKGKIVSKETREKLRKAMMGKIPSKETVEKIIAVRKSHNVRHSQETKRKISESNKGKHQGLSGEANYNSKQVIDVFTNQIFGCIKEVAKIYNIHYKRLLLKLNNKIKNDTNFRFLKKENNTLSVEEIEEIKNNLLKDRVILENKKTPIINKQKRINHTELTKEKIGKANKGNQNGMYGKTGEQSMASKKVIDIKTGITYVSIKEAALFNNINVNNLQNRLKGVVKNDTSLRYLTNV